MTEPATEKTREHINALAAGIDSILNGDSKGRERKVAFVLLLTNFDDPDCLTNYVSNAERGSIIRMMKGVIERFEKQEANR
jgi:hypothetical protein